MPIKVLVVEDDPVIFMLYTSLLEKHDDIEIIGHAKSKDTAIEMAKELTPDVMLVDINLTHKEDQHGVDVAIETALFMPEVRVLMCSSIINEDTVRSTVGIGVATNYILKTEPDKIPQAIRDAYNDQSHIDGEVVDYVLKDYRETLKSTMVKLTSHHIKVLELFYRGYGVEEVANILKLETQSVRNLQQEIAKRCLGWQWRFRKLSVVELAKRAKALGLFQFFMMFI